ncbi:MAG: hypothetical protein K2K96_13480 [Lachnospiraceae bacterium]|nr:hypothetical protein [Lachnospiraceae bacterium]
MKGKAKCKALKEIRRQIAETNDIPYAVSQCTYQGDCKGTCPKCEAELKYLERELALRQSLGKAVAVTGISVGVCASLTACTPEDLLKYIPGYEYEEVIAGDAPMPVTTTTVPLDAEGAIEIVEPEDETSDPETPESPENAPTDEINQKPSPETPPKEIDGELIEIEGDIELIEEDIPLAPETEGEIYIEEDN